MSKRRIVLEETGEVRYPKCDEPWWNGSAIRCQIRGGFNQYPILRVVSNQFSDPPVVDSGAHDYVASTSGETLAGQNGGTFPAIQPEPPANSPETPDSSIIAELRRDLEALEANISQFYCHVTGQRLSKPFTDPDAVIAEVDEILNREVDEAVKERIAELVAYLWSQLDACPRCEDDSCGYCRDIKALIDKAGGGERPRRPVMEDRPGMSVEAFAETAGKAPPVAIDALRAAADAFGGDDDEPEVAEDAVSGADQDWKPIESAPKEAVCISRADRILAWDGQQVVTAAWNVQGLEWRIYPGNLRFRNGYPTHWRPLPPGPNQRPIIAELVAALLVYTGRCACSSEGVMCGCCADAKALIARAEK